MSYKTHALNEFRAAGWVDESGKFKDDMQEAICKHVMKLLDVFDEGGHSGSSAPYAIDLFKTLASFEPVVPLTGEDWEWNEICDDRTDGVSVYQNKRCSHVFKQADRFNGQPYDIDGIVFWEWYKGDGGEPVKCHYKCSESFVPVTFPYTPNIEYKWRATENAPAQTEEGIVE